MTTKLNILFLCTGCLPEGGLGALRRVAGGDSPDATRVAPLGLPLFPVQE